MSGMNFHLDSGGRDLPSTINKSIYLSTDLSMVWHISDVYPIRPTSLLGARPSRRSPCFDGTSLRGERCRRAPTWRTRARRGSRRPPAAAAPAASPWWSPPGSAGSTAETCPAASKKGKVFPYSLPSVGPGADPGVQAVSPQVTWSESRHILGSRQPLLSARPAVTPVAFTRWRYL